MIEMAFFTLLVVVAAVLFVAALWFDAFSWLVQHKVAISVLIVQALIGVVIFDLTKMSPVAIFAALATGVLATSIYRSRLAKRRLELLGDLASLARRISDSVGGGSDLTHAILVSCINPPYSLSEHLEKLALALPTQGIDYALEAFAYEIDESSAHLLSAHLIQANRFPSGRLGPALRSIATEIEAHVDSDRELATLRRQQDFEIRGLSLVLTSVVIFVFSFMPGLTDVFNSTAGAQGLIGVIVLAAVGWLTAARLSSRVTVSQFSLRRSV